jgi:chromosome partitioning protein
VTMPDEDVAARGRSIFERLRAEQEALAAVPDRPVLRWADLPLAEPPPATMEIAAHAPPAAPPPQETAEAPLAPPPAPIPGATAVVTAQAPGPVVATPPVMPDLPPLVEPAATAVETPPSPYRVGAPPAERPSFARPLPRILAIANQKGGVGKTTTTVNLGASLAVLGYRVLVVDLDPQGNATTGLGINSRNLEHSIYDVILHDVPLDDCVEPTSLRNLYVAPATIDLAGAEIELVPAFSRELRLRRALEEVRDDYDFVLIDCPPSLGLLTVNGLAAATEVLVPIQCEYYALEGLGQLLRNVNLVQSNLNPKLEVSAIVLTMYDARTKLAEQVADEVRTHFGPKVCRNVVPRTVRLSEAPSFGQPIIVFDPSSRGALAYRELAKEVSGGAPQRAG